MSTDGCPCWWQSPPQRERAARRRWRRSSPTARHITNTRSTIFPSFPHVAVLDYTVTLGLPKQITATTGMDALTHAVEAYIGRSTTKQTRQMAERATVLIHDNLLRAYQNGADAEARQNMLYAAYCAGVAFTKSYVGYVHAVAHSLGGQYRIPHGFANAVILPYFLKAYGAACHRPLAGWPV